MKKYTNTGRRLVCLCFKGQSEAVYLRRGQSHETDADPVSVPVEVTVDVLSAKKGTKVKDIDGEQE